MRDSALGDSMVLSGVGAVGTSTRVGEHLKAVAADFAARSPRAQTQLNKVGVDHEVCLELQETLMSLANRCSFCRNKHMLTMSQYIILQELPLIC